MEEFKKYHEVKTKNNEEKMIKNIELNGEQGQIDFDELLIQNGMKHYPENLHPTIYSLCKKYGSSRYNEIFQLSNTIGNENNSIPYLQIVGMPGTGKYSIIKDYLKRNNSIFGYINGNYSKWLCNSKGNNLHKLSVDNLFVKPIEQIKKKLIKRGIFKMKNKRFKDDLFEDEIDESTDTVNNLIEFIDELRSIKKEYSQSLINESKDNENSKEIKSKCIFLIVKDVTTISKNKPDLLLTLLKLHEHLRDVVLFPIEKRRVRVYVNICVIFIDHYGIPEDFFCNHNPIPIIWFSSYNDVQCFDIIVNSRINRNIQDFEINNSFNLQENNHNWIIFNSLKISYRNEFLEFVKKTDKEYLGIRLIGVTNDNFESFVSTQTLYSIWTEFVAETITMLHPYLKSDFQELIFKFRYLWPIFLFPLISGEIGIAKKKLIEESEYINELIQSLIKRFKRHHSSIIRNLYSHHIPELFQGDLILTKEFSKPILNYSFLKNTSRMEMPYFSKLLLVSAYVASKIPKKNDNKLFYNLVSSKLRSNKSKRRKKSEFNLTNDENKEDNKAFSLIRWLAITDCIAFHITGTHGIDQSTTILEQINNITKLGLVASFGNKYTQSTQIKSDLQKPLNNISPVSDLTIGQNIGIEMIMYKQNHICGINNLNYNYNNSKITHIDSPINIEDPRSLYVLQAPNSIIETFASEIGILLKEIIPE